MRFNPYATYLTLKYDPTDHRLDSQIEPVAWMPILNFHTEPYRLNPGYDQPTPNRPHRPSLKCVSRCRDTHFQGYIRHSKFQKLYINPQTTEPLAQMSAKSLLLLCFH